MLDERLYALIVNITVDLSVVLERVPYIHFRDEITSFSYDYRSPSITIGPRNPRSVSAEMAVASELYRRIAIVLDQANSIADESEIKSRREQVENKFGTSLEKILSISYDLHQQVKLPPPIFVFNVLEVGLNSPIKIKAGLAALMIVGSAASLEARPMIEKAAPYFEVVEVVKDIVELINALKEVFVEFIPSEPDASHKRMANDYYTAFKEEWSKNSVRTTQECLNLLGYDPGRIDGVLGKDTRRALKNFADEHGIIPEPGDALWEILSQAAAAKAHVVSQTREHPQKRDA
jgi:hypothetical protein